MGYRLSPSSLSLMGECERCFWLYVVKKIRRPDGIVSSLPNGMDLVLKRHFDSFRGKDELPPELREKCKEYKLFGDVGLLDKWRNNRKGIEYVENGVVLMGAVDEILVKPGKLVVLDFKTRGFPRKENTHEYYRDKMNLYNFLLRKNGHSTEDYNYLLFYHPKFIDENGNFVFNADLVKMDVDVVRAEELFKKGIEIVNGEIPEGSVDCEYCKLRGDSSSSF